MRAFLRKHFFRKADHRAHPAFAKTWGELIEEPRDSYALISYIRTTEPQNLNSAEFILRLDAFFKKLKDTPSAYAFNLAAKPLAEMNSLERQEDAKVAIWALAIESAMMQRVEDILVETGEKITPPNIAIKTIEMLRGNSRIYQQNMQIPMAMLCKAAELRRENFVKGVPAQVQFAFPLQPVA